jgi:RHS repeat-associated protein
MLDSPRRSHESWALSEIGCFLLDASTDGVRRTRRLLAISLLGLPLAFPLSAQSIVAQINVNCPMGLAVNSITNKVYVAGISASGVCNPTYPSGPLTVIDGATNNSSIVLGGYFPTSVAADEQTNKIYVGDLFSNVTIVDGGTNTSATLGGGYGAMAIAVNPATNKIYAAIYEGGIGIIDGATNGVSVANAFIDGYSPTHLIGINSKTNRIYVASPLGGTVTVVDGATGNSTVFQVGGEPQNIAVNERTNKIYVSATAGSFIVIDGETNNITPVTITEPNPILIGARGQIAIDSITNKIYIPDTVDGCVVVIDGATNNSTCIATVPFPVSVAVNESTNRIYVGSESYQTGLTVIDGATSETTFIPALASELAVNPVTGRVYAMDSVNNVVTVINDARAPVITGPPPVLSNADGQSLTGPAQSPTSKEGSSAEPVSTGSGNYIYQHTDTSTAGRGLPLVFQRSYNAQDTYSGPLGTNWNHSYNVVLTQTASGVANIRFGDGHGEIFTLSGTTYVPQPGVWSTLIANADGTLTYTQKNRTQYAFSSSGQLNNVTDRNGNTITLVYDESGHLIQINGTTGRNLVLAYDASNRITMVTDPIGRAVHYLYSANNDLASVIDQAGGVTQYSYDASHHVTSITLPNGAVLLQNTYDTQGRVIAQVNGRGYSWTFGYNTPGTGQTTITDARGANTIHSYDASLRLIGITDALDHTVSYEYDANNNRISVTNQNANTTDIAYDSTGNVTSITDPLSNVASFTYDANNNLLTATSPKGATTAFAYDGHNNLTMAQDASGNKTAFAFDVYGELISKTNAKSQKTTLSYNSFGDLSSITNALGSVTGLAYDGIGRLVSITDANHHTASCTYDLLGRLVSVIDPLGDKTQFSYDPVGNLLANADANGHVTSYSYDSVNNLVTVTDALGHITRYGYDNDNNRVSFTNAKGNATQYSYDSVNRLSTVTDPLSFSTSYSYDSVGNVVSVTDAKSSTNQFAYDAVNRLLAITYADGKNVAYSYDANGNRSSMADSHGTTNYGYDPLDRLVTVANPGGKTVGYTYDAVGNRTSLNYPDGKLLTYSYDSANRLAQVVDWLGRGTNYSNDPASNLTNIQYPNGAGMGFNYDAANRLTQMTNTEKGIPPLTLTYSLDPVGNRTTISVNGIPTNFAYDSLNELVSAQLGPLVPTKTTWSYDAVGNRLLEASVLGATKYAYDSADRLLTAGTRTFTYDSNGNRVSVTDASIHQTRAFTYDAANRLTGATGPKNSLFSYDGDGNRIMQSVASGTYNYANDIAAGLPVVLQESGPDGNITYAYGRGLIEEAAPAFNYFYQYDGLGSVIGLTDAKGIPQGADAYDAWGNTLLSVTDVGTRNKFRYTGEALDPGTGLYFLRARYYDPSVGRFASKDPFLGLSRQPLTLNRFVYGLNQPTNLFDHSGFAADGNSSNTAASFPFMLSGTEALTNSGSTIPLAPMQQPSTQPTTTGPYTSTCLVELQTPPQSKWFDVGMDILGIIELLVEHNPAAPQTFGPIPNGQSGGYLIQAPCTKGIIT